MQTKPTSNNAQAMINGRRMLFQIAPSRDGYRAPCTGAAETTAIDVSVVLAGRHGEKISSVTPMPLARGAVHCKKSIVAVITPVIVASPVAAAVALARIEKPQM